jgi:3-oxoacyl-(acyl-carrier-protein) synthase
MKIFVTGISAVSGMGLNVHEHFQALKNHQTGIKKSVKYGFMFAEVALENDQIITQCKLPNEDYSRATLLGILAAQEAWGNNKISSKIKTGFINATSVGALDKMEHYYFENKKNNSDKYYDLLIQENGFITERIAQEIGIKGYINTISTACSSGANAIMHGARMMQAHKLDRVLVGACEPLSLFNINGFNALNILDTELCKPFDENRKGLNLGEGAAYLVLENEKSIAETGNKPLCLLSGWNNSTDAFHQTASSANGIGATLTMQKALEKANLKPENIDYINAHGTGTGNNDLSESMAIENVFEKNIPDFSSTKGFTGHTLATAGAIEAVFCVQAILQQCLLPNLNFKTAMKETNFKPIKKFTENVKIENVLSNSFGFGGNCTSLIFSKI